MAAKSILNELYQRLRTAAPIYKTQADNESDGFICTLTLPAVECECEALSVDRTFQGSGASKKEAEHAAAHAAVELLTEERILRTDAAPTTSHSSRGTSALAAGGLSPSVSSTKSGLTYSGVGSKRSKSSADQDEDSNENLELRVLETLTAVYPKALNGAQLAKLCGHFKLKSKVNHILYMKLKASGQVEMLDSHPPAWRAVPSTAPAAAAALLTPISSNAALCLADEPQLAPAATVAAAYEQQHNRLYASTSAHAASAVDNDDNAFSGVAGLAQHQGQSKGHCGYRQGSPAAAAAVSGGAKNMLTGTAAAGHSPPPCHTQPAAKQARLVSSRGPQQVASRQQQQQVRQHSSQSGGSHGLPPVSSWLWQQQQQQSGGALQQGAASGTGASSRWQASSRPAAAAAAPPPTARVLLQGTAAAPALGQQQQQQCSQQSCVRSYNQEQSDMLNQSHSSLSNSQSCGRSTTAATAAAARAKHQHHQQQQAAAVADPIRPQARNADLAVAQSTASAAAAAVSGGRLYASVAEGDDTDDDDISPAVIAAATEAASLEPAPFAAPGVQSNIRGANSHQQQQQADRRSKILAEGCAAGPSLVVDAATADQAALQQQQQQQQLDLLGLLQPHLDLLAAMQLNEQPVQQQQQRLTSQGNILSDIAAAREQPAASLTAGAASVPAATATDSVRLRSVSRPQLEAGIKRKYPAFSNPGEHVVVENEHAVAAASGADAALSHAAGVGMSAATGQQQIHAIAAAAAAVMEGIVLDVLPHQLQEQQHGTQQQQEDHQSQRVEHRQPQRRRRRSGQDRDKQGPAAAAAGGVGYVSLERAGSTSHSVAAAAATVVCAESGDDASSEDIQMSAAVDAPCLPAAAAADLAAALLHLSAGSSQQQQQPSPHDAGDILLATAQPGDHGTQHMRQKQQQGNQRQLLDTAMHLGSTATAGAGLLCQGFGGFGIRSESQSQWAGQGLGSSSNPWTWQWQGQQGLGFFQGDTTAAAAESEGNGSCPGWPTTTLRQQPQSPNAQGFGRSRLSQGFHTQSVSPGPSGQMVRASAVVGGTLAKSQEPAAAAAAATTVDELLLDDASSAARALLQQQQAAPVDLQQSEEQALQLLSRLALPESRTITAAAPVASAPQQLPASGVGCCEATAAAPADASPSANEHVAAIPSTAAPLAPAGGLHAGGSADPLEVAVAAAAAAAKAAAAMAAAAGFRATAPAPGVGSDQGLPPAAPAAAVSSNKSVEDVFGSIGAGVDPSTAPKLVAAGSALITGPRASATVDAYNSQLQTVLTTAQGLEVALGGQHNCTAATPAAQAPKPIPSQQQTMAGNTMLPSTGVRQQQQQPRVQSELCVTDLQEEYERRMAAVKDLVQQLNDALQGLNSIREQVEGK